MLIRYIRVSLTTAVEWGCQIITLTAHIRGIVRRALSMYYVVISPLRSSIPAVASLHHTYITHQRHCTLRFVHVLRCDLPPPLQHPPRNGCSHPASLFSRSVTLQGHNNQFRSRPVDPPKRLAPCESSARLRCSIALVRPNGWLIVPFAITNGGGDPTFTAPPIELAHALPSHIVLVAVVPLRE